MKKGIALLITLFFILASISIIGYIYASLQKSINNSNVFIKVAQNSLLIKEIESQLKSRLNNIENSKELHSIFLETPQIIDKKFSFKIKIDTNLNKLNLNLINKKNSSNYVTNFLNKVLDEYEIVEKDYFIDLIKDSIDLDYEERSYSSEIYHEIIERLLDYLWEHSEDYRKECEYESETWQERYWTSQGWL